MWFRPGPNLVLDHRDARVALADPLADPAHGARFDVIVGDAFHDISVPQHLTTAEFAALLRARLEPQGFYALNVVDSSSRPLFLYAVARTLATAFAEVEVWIDAAQVRASERITYLVVAAAQPSGIGELEDRGASPQLWFQWPREDLDRRLARARVPVLTDDYAPVDRLMLDVPPEDR
jgi:spermidine synthase